MSGKTDDVRDDSDLSEEELVRLKMEIYGISEPEARMIVAIERGELDGDVIIEDEPEP